jgi:hypothetical protein
VKGVPGYTELGCARRNTPAASHLPQYPGVPTGRTLFDNVTLISEPHSQMLISEFFLIELQ